MSGVTTFGRLLSSRSVSRKLITAYVYIRGDGRNTKKCLIVICRYCELDPLVEFMRQKYRLAKHIFRLLAEFTRKAENLVGRKKQNADALADRDLETLQVIR